MEHKLSLEEQVQRLRDFYGIEFVRISEEKALDYLGSNTYYAKIRSYLTSFVWNEHTQKYVKVDFEALVRLATFDMFLRKCLLSLLLDVEHLYKTYFIRLLTNDDEVDGYSIIKECRGYVDPDAIVARTSGSDYSILSANRFAREKNVWNLVELMSFSDFRSLFAFYADQKNLRELRFLSSLLQNANVLRNACAHNSALLHNLNKEINHYIFTPNTALRNFLSDRVLVPSRSTERLVEIPITHDIAASVLLLAIFPNNPLFLYRLRDLEAFLARCLVYKELFKSQYHLRIMHRDFSLFLKTMQKASEEGAIEYI